MKKHFPLILIGLLVLSGVGLALGPNPNPGVIPNTGPKYGELSAEWWQWAFSFAVADLPLLSTGGPVDLRAHQLGAAWCLPGANDDLTDPRTVEVPAGTSLFLPLVNLINQIGFIQSVAGNQEIDPVR